MDLKRILILAILTLSLVACGNSEPAADTAETTAEEAPAKEGKLEVKIANPSDSKEGSKKSTKEKTKKDQAKTKKPAKTAEKEVASTETKKPATNESSQAPATTDPNLITQDGEYLSLGNVNSDGSIVDGYGYHYYAQVNGDTLTVKGSFKILTQEGSFIENGTHTFRVTPETVYTGTVADGEFEISIDTFNLDVSPGMTIYVSNGVVTKVRTAP